MMIIPVILAGGSGTRLWPLSRRLYPKQLLSLTHERTLLQHTIMRVVGVEDVADPIVICNDAYRYMTADQLKEINVTPHSMVLEPAGRNTAPAVAVAAIMARAVDPAAMILVLPADHLIPDVDKFHRALEAAACFADLENLVTFGVVPRTPETGYGYIRKGESISCQSKKVHDAFKIYEFVEKPDFLTARQYVESGEYCWNSGMFMFRAESIIKEMELLAPEIMEACFNAVDHGVASEGALMLDPDAFCKCPSDSIDYAVMEKTHKGAMVPFDAGWNDVGSWEALWELGVKDEAGNVINGDVLSRDSSGCLVFAENRLVTLLGMKDTVVVETSDAILVAGRGCCQDVKFIVDELKSKKREEAICRGKTFHQWGSVALQEKADNSVVRRVVINGQCTVKVKTPTSRILHWIVADGRGELIKSGETLLLHKDTAVRIEPETMVTIENKNDQPLVFMEVYLSANKDREHFTES